MFFLLIRSYLGRCLVMFSVLVENYQDKLHFYPSWRNKENTAKSFGVSPNFIIFSKTVWSKNSGKIELVIALGLCVPRYAYSFAICISLSILCKYGSYSIVYWRHLPCSPQRNFAKARTNGLCPPAGRISSNWRLCRPASPVYNEQPLPPPLLPPPTKFALGGTVEDKILFIF